MKILSVWQKRLLLAWLALLAVLEQEARPCQTQIGAALKCGTVNPALAGVVVIGLLGKRVAWQHAGKSK